jgi:transketolase
MKSYEILGQKDTRSGFGAGLHEAGKLDSNVVALCADLTGSLMMDAFKDEFPERFIQAGIAEANMIRVYDQIRQSVAYSHKNVKICASHAGLTLGEDGATHQILEDIGLMKMLPNMVVINPCDYNQTKAATMAIAKYDGPVYLRFGRPKWPVFIPEDMPFEIGKALMLNEGKDVTIFATGHMVWKAIEAGHALAEKGIDAEVINIHTIKPLDRDAILASVKKTGCVVSAEEHQMNGGLGDSIAQLLSRELPTPMEFVAVNDSFGESGTPDQLLEKYGLTTAAIVAAAERAVLRKG